MNVFRRQIVLRAETRTDTEGRGEVRAALEDDFHHFRVALKHAGGAVTGITGTAPRHPYSLCPQAAEPLTRLVGAKLERVANSVTRLVDGSGQCTHLLDLAGLAMAAAARGILQRRYEMEVPQREQGRTRARLVRDGRALLEWDIHDKTILGPAPFEGIDLRQGMARWALSSLDEDTAEAALALRRCALISLGRTRDLDAETHARTTGLCFSQQPERATQALRMKGSTWDFSARAGALCADDRDWLAFRE